MVDLWRIFCGTSEVVWYGSGGLASSGMAPIPNYIWRQIVVHNLLDGACAWWGLFFWWNVSIVASQTGVIHWCIKSIHGWLFGMSSTTTTTCYAMHANGMEWHSLSIFISFSFRYQIQLIVHLCSQSHWIGTSLDPWLGMELPLSFPSVVWLLFQTYHSFFYHSNTAAFSGWGIGVIGFLTCKCQGKYSSIMEVL